MVIWSGRGGAARMIAVVDGSVMVGSGGGEAAIWSCFGSTRSARIRCGTTTSRRGTGREGVSVLDRAEGNAAETGRAVSRLLDGAAATDLVLRAALLGVL